MPGQFGGRFTCKPPEKATTHKFTAKARSALLNMVPVAPYMAAAVQIQKDLASAPRRLHHAGCDVVEAPGLPCVLVGDASLPGAGKFRLRDAWMMACALDLRLSAPEPGENAG